MKGRIEDIEMMLNTGETVDGIAQRLNIQRGSVYRYVHRAGRTDLHAKLMNTVATPHNQWQLDRLRGAS